MFRKIGTSKIGILLAILFGISLLFFRSGSQYSNIFNSDNVVANISGTKISTTKFNRTLQMNINQFSQMIGKEMTNQDIKALQIPSLALGALINDAIFENEFDKKNFKLDKKLIALKTKERIPNLYKGNELNERYLNEFLKSQQLKIEDIVQIINFETRNEFFDEAFLNINFPKTFSDKIQAYENQVRSIKYTKFHIDSFDSGFAIETNKKILKDFYNENINSYMDQEKRDIEYIIIDKNKILEESTPNNFEISEYYENNKKLFFENEKRSFLQFNFKTNDEAASFQKETGLINNFTEIEKYAKKNNIRYSTFQELPYENLLDEIANPLFKLEINEKSKIIESNIAKHILVLTDIKEQKQLTFDEVKDQITNQLIQIEANNNFESLKEGINQSILDGKSLFDISNDYQLGKVNDIKSLKQNFSDFDENEKKFFYSLISNGFASSQDFVSDIIDLDEKSFYIFNVKRIVEKKPIEFESIKEKILDDYKLSIKIKSIEKLIENNKSNDNFIDLQSNIHDSDVLTLELNKQSNDFPTEFISKMFEEKIKNNTYFIYKDEVHFANISEILINENTVYEEQISLKDDLKGSLANELMKNIEISTNDSLINALIDRY